MSSATVSPHFPRLGNLLNEGETYNRFGEDENSTTKADSGVIVVDKIDIPTLALQNKHAYTQKHIRINRVGLAVSVTILLLSLTNFGIWPALISIPFAFGFASMLITIHVDRNSAR